MAVLFVWGSQSCWRGKSLRAVGVGGVLRPGEDCPEVTRWQPRVHVGDSIVAAGTSGGLLWAAQHCRGLPWGLRDDLSLQIDYFWFAQKAFMAL